MSRWALLHVAGIFFAASLVAAVSRQAFGHDTSPSLLSGGAPRRQVHLPVKDFSLTDQAGKPFRFQSLKGKVVLVSFIYTTCPDVCPLITSSMRLVQQGLSPGERESAFFLSITTDPEVDTPEVLRSYAERYKIDFSRWSLVTGDLQSLIPVWKVFGVRVERKARGLIHHTSLTGLIDKKGVMRFAYYGSSPDHKRVLQDMRALLAQ